MATSAPEFSISRVVNAPRETVWKSWTVPELMAQWWGPKGFTVGKYTLDLRPGGTYHYSMRSPDGSLIWGKFIYRDIVVPEKLVFVNSFSDEKGGITRHPMSPNWPLELLSTVTFTAHGSKTQVTIRWVPLNANEVELKTFAESLPGMQVGWNGTLDQFENYLKQAA